MNKKLLKTVATMASASLVMLSTATCFADAITTSTKSEFDFSTGNVKVTTTAANVGTGKMITYLLANTESVTAGSNILYIDQQTTTGADVTFSCTVDITKLETVAAVMKMGSNAGHTFTTDAEELASVVDDADVDVSTVQVITDAESMTVVAKVNSYTEGAKYGATLKKDGYEDIKIYAVNASGGDATSTDGLSDGKYYAITVTGLDNYTGFTLEPFAEVAAE